MPIQPQPSDPQAPPKSWRELLPIHPAADLFPLMTPDELRALGKDIKKTGLTSPIVLWRDDREAEAALLDGRNRLDAIETVIGPVHVDLDDEEIWIGSDGNVRWRDSGVTIIGPPFDPYTYVISANIRRRHLTAEQKRELIATVLKATPEKSDRQIAETAKASPTTVGTVRREMEGKGKVSKLDTRTDAKGVKQPAHKPPTAPAAAPKPRLAKPDTKAQCAIALQLVDAGYRALALKSHPDSGGSTAAMEQLSQLRDWLRRYVETSKFDTPDFHRLMKLSDALKHAGRVDSGEVAAPSANVAVLVARVEELQAEKRRLEIENIGLRSEVEELKARLATAPPADAASTSRRGCGGRRHERRRPHCSLPHPSRRCRLASTGERGWLARSRPRERLAARRSAIGARGCALVGVESRRAPHSGAGAMTITTVSSLRRSRRRLDRHQLSVGGVLDAMKRGAALHLQYQNGRALWSLSSGPFVTADIAAIVITKPSVVSVDAALFLRVPGLTWRFAEQTEDSR